ncbi:MAG: hypothetical protein ACM65L_21695 [Microcoleus sp.]
MTFEAVLNLVKHLSLAEKLRLIKWIVPEIERELVVLPTPGNLCGVYVLTWELHPLLLI